MLPSLLAKFKKAHPDIEIDLRTDNREAIGRLVLRGEVDVAMINNAPSNRFIALEPYRWEPVVAFVPSNHPLAKKRAPDWHDIERVPFIMRKPLGGRGTAHRLVQLMRKQGLKLKVALYCDSPEAVKAAVKKKMGMGLIFKETIEPEISRGEFKIIKLPGQRLEGQSFIAYRKGRPLSPNSRDFLDLLRKHRRNPR